MSDAESSLEAAEKKNLVNASDAYLVLRNRDFRLYLIGRLIASNGQQMGVMAIGWDLHERAHPAVALPFIGLTQVAPMVLLTLPAGHIADNYNRKKIVVLMTLVVLASSFGLMLASAGHAPLIWTYVCLTVMGAARTFMWAASAAFLPALVDRKDLSHA